jgi:hypothetical protein
MTGSPQPSQERNDDDPDGTQHNPHGETANLGHVVMEQLTDCPAHP